MSRFNVYLHDISSTSGYLFYPSCPLSLSPILGVRWVPLSRTICQYYLPYSAVGTIHKEVLKYILLYCLLTWSFNHARTSSCTLYFSVSSLGRHVFNSGFLVVSRSIHGSTREFSGSSLPGFTWMIWTFQYYVRSVLSLMIIQRLRPFSLHLFHAYQGNPTAGRRQSQF